MPEYSFSLLPFPDLNLPDIKLTGHIVRQNHRLTIHYSISGETQKILFPTKSIDPTRKDELWTTTCFEFFLALPNQPQYWEFNMSPTGDWNVYHIDAYRRIGFREEISISSLQFQVKNGPDSIVVDASVDLTPILGAESSIHAGITSVIQTTDGHESYWALIHPNPQADFHLRESFIILL